MASVLTVILNWRTPALTCRALDAALVAMEGVEGAISVVDNASGDGSAAAIAAHLAARGPGPVPVLVLESGRNGGFGAGNNFGIRAGLPGGGRPDFVYLLNSDAFPDPGAIRALRDHLVAHPRSGMAGSHIRGSDGQAHRTAFRFPSVAGEFEAQARLGPVSRMLTRYIVAAPLPTATGPVDWLAGASLMLRSEMLDEIGHFDETFFLYFEETDLCRRAAAAGWQRDFVCESRVVHEGSASTGMKRWRRIPGYWLDSRWHYFVKAGGRGHALAATAAALAGGGLWRLRCALTGRDPIDPPHLLSDMARHHARALFAPAPPCPHGGSATPAE